jgi:hypothetical protein
MYRKSILLSVVLGGVAGPSSAQVLQPWSEPTSRSVSLDVLRPAFDGGGTTTLTTVNQLGVRWAVGSLVLIAEAPFVLARVDGASSGAFLIGNPFLGFGTAPTSSFIGDIGVRIPIVSASTLERGFASAVGVVGDFQDFEAYGEDLLTLRATVGYRTRAPNHYGLRVAARPTLVKPIGSSSGDAELLLDYGIQGGYDNGRASFGISFTGRGIVTEPGSIGERTVHDLAVGGSMTFGRIRPGIQIRVPLENDVGQALNYSLGLTVQMAF